MERLREVTAKELLDGVMHCMSYFQNAPDYELTPVDQDIAAKVAEDCNSEHNMNITARETAWMLAISNMINNIKETPIICNCK